MLFGDRTSLDEARRIVDSGHDAGINFIDTADAYVNGESERVTADFRWLASQMCASGLVLVLLLPVLADGVGHFR